MADELDSARAAIVAARVSGTRIDEEALRVERGRRIGELLASHRDAEPALRAVLADWEAASGGQAVHGNLHLEAHATDSSRVYQAGHDQHITGRRASGTGRRPFGTRPVTGLVRQSEIVT
jgi:hypothetical protein